MAVKKGKQGSGDPMAKAAAKARKRWAESREKKDEFAGGLKFGEIEDGQYAARLVKARCGVTKQGEGDIYISMDYVLRGGDYDGTQVDVYHDLKSDKSSDAMARTLKRLDFEIAELDPADITDLVKELNANPPDVMLSIKNVDKDKEGNALDEPRAYVNVNKTIGTEDNEPAKPARAKPSAKKPAKKKG